MDKFVTHMVMQCSCVIVILFLCLLILMNHSHLGMSYFEAVFLSDDPLFTSLIAFFRDMGSHLLLFFSFWTFGIVYVF